MNIVGIQFDNDEKLKYYSVENLVLNKNVTVIVKNEDNLHFGKVVTPIHPIDKNNLKKNIGQVLRIASKNDYTKHLNNLKQAKQALKKCIELVEKHKLKMEIMDATYTFDQDQLVFTFFAESRVDFRDLARDLAAIYKTRIELRQIGVRDKAKKVSGIGQCGQKLCCARFLDEFDSVSISMAKNQNLSLNPTKINGVCGRLLCCLKYENECYKECRKKLPTIGQTIEVEGIKGKVISLDILKKSYKVNTENGVVEVNLDGSN